MKCKVSKYSSRTCERGIKGCDIVHNIESRKTLESFIDEEKANLLRFQKYWDNKRKQGSKRDYPLKMSYGDWLDQFAIFAEIREEEDDNLL